MYIDGQPAQNQGYTQDNDNYYVWYTTHFSTHQISIVFTASSPNPTASHGGASAQANFLQITLGVVTAIVLVTIVVFVLKLVMRDKKSKS